MSTHYVSVQWNRQKRLYDLVLWAGIVVFVAVFVGGGFVLNPAADETTLLIRAFGIGALLLLHFVLCIGPLARLDSRFLPLLYNRRHLGVSTFLLGLVHAALVVFQYHLGGDRNALVSVLTSNQHIESISRFPFELFGVAALLILFVMAVTSHDFWLKNLTPPLWKALHMTVYLAFVLLALHVSLGVLQQEHSSLLAGLFGLGLAMVLGLQLWASLRGHGLDRELPANAEGYIEVGPVEAIPDGRAVIATIAGERIAVFRDGHRICVLSNVCRHQNAPLGEGHVVKGLVTCPWHGYQYRLEDGQSPPPFTERVPTFRVKLVEGKIWVDPKPNLPGTYSEPAIIEDNRP